jgi:[CysO sulfur-carrier protein]-S-L-cysteine hydrolase
LVVGARVARPYPEKLKMQISQRMLDEIIEHAREDLPNECCGLIGGIDEKAETVYRARNEFASPFSYRVHGDDQYRIIEKEMRERGEELLAIYHSHTKSPAYPSQTDLNEAASWPEQVYLIVSLANREAPEVKAFWLKDDEIAEAELVVG